MKQVVHQLEEMVCVLDLGYLMITVRVEMQVPCFSTRGIKSFGKYDIRIEELSKLKDGGVNLMKAIWIF